MNKVLVGAGLVLLMVLLVIFGPLTIIWALNTLFPLLAINYGFFQWLAVVVLNLTWFSKYEWLAVVVPNMTWFSKYHFKKGD